MSRDFGWMWGWHDWRMRYWRDYFYHNLCVGPFYCWWLHEEATDAE